MNITCLLFNRRNSSNMCVFFDQRKEWAFVQQWHVFLFPRWSVFQKFYQACKLPLILALLTLGRFQFFLRSWILLIITWYRFNVNYKDNEPTQFVDMSTYRENV